MLCLGFRSQGLGAVLWRALLPRVQGLRILGFQGLQGSTKAHARCSSRVPRWLRCAPCCCGPCVEKGPCALQQPSVAPRCAALLRTPCLECCPSLNPEPYTLSPQRRGCTPGATAGCHTGCPSRPAAESSCMTTTTGMPCIGPVQHIDSSMQTGCVQLMAHVRCRCYCCCSCCRCRCLC